MRSDVVRVVHGERDADERDRLEDRFADVADVVVEGVSSVDDVVEALDAADCVVSGSSLVDGDWRDLLSAVRERDPVVPIVLYPPTADAKDASDASSAGAVDYLPRPLDEDDELLDRIRRGVETYDRWRRARQAETIFSSIMETIPVSIYVKDAQARYVAASSRLAESTAADPIGKTDAELWASSGGESALETYRDDLTVIETGEPIVDRDERHLTGGGSWVRTTKLPWRVDDEIAGLLGISWDVTALKVRQEELQRKTQRLEQFASFASHDLRNPIAIALGYMDAYRETGDESALEEVDEALERMDALIGDLLTMVRRDEETVTWIELADVAERIWEALDTDEATLHVDVPPGTTIEAADGQFRQLLANLFQNAVEHAGPDVEVTIEATQFGFSVEDDGPGIDAEDPNVVFEYGHTDGGTGIGLTIVREIADGHGWDVTVTDGAHGGARFEFDRCLLREDGGGDVVEGPSVTLTDATDVGGATPAGSYEYDDETWTVHGGGADVWGTVDEHFYAYATVERDVRIVGRVAALEPVHEYSKAGLMVRGGTEAGEVFGYVGVTPAHGPEVIERSTPATESESVQFDDYSGAPRWCRIDRIGSAVTCAISDDGHSWTTLDRTPISLETPITVGLVVCSHDPDQSCRAVFDGVRVVELVADE